MPNRNTLKKIVFPGAVVPFAPDPAILALSPLRWWKPDASQVLKTAGRLRQVNDLSGNSGHLLQSIETNKALWVDGVLNGKPIMRFDDTDIFFNFTSVSPNDMTAYVVFRPDAEITPATAFQTLFGRISGVNPRVLCSFGITTGNLANETFSFIAVPTIKGVAMTSNISATFHNLMFSLEGTTERIEMDAVNESLNVSSAGGLDASTEDRFINVDSLGHSSSSFDGDIAEVILFNSAHNDTNRTIVENYFNSEFAI